MTLTEIKQLSIREYLNNLGIHPVKEYGYYGLYHSPFREDRNASFKVDYRKNLWHDFGTGEGGTMIDLVMKMENCSLLEAVNMLERKYADVQKDSWANNPLEIEPISPTMVITNIAPITYPKLTAWVQERNIDLDLANLYCREIHYRNQSGQFFSIGFRNDKGGYELSSPPNFKGCFSPKEITTFQNGSDTCLVFEGFWDFLSYLTLQKIEKSKHDVAVLNSVANVQKAMDFLKSYKEIHTYLDNDDAGRKATELIQSANSTVYNCSTKFAEYKDLNDYLCQKPMAKPEVKKKNLGIKR